MAYKDTCAKAALLPSLLLLSPASSSRLMTLLFVTASAFLRFSSGILFFSHVLSPHGSIVNSNFYRINLLSKWRMFTYTSRTSACKVALDPNAGDGESISYLTIFEFALTCDCARTSLSGLLPFKSSKLFFLPLLFSFFLFLRLRSSFFS